MSITDASRYSVGNNVYLGGSSSATKGAVDPTGYIDRELARRPASRIDKRTYSGFTPGVAAGAISRIRTGYPTSNPDPIPVDQQGPSHNEVSGRDPKPGDDRGVVPLIPRAPRPATRTDPTGKVIFDIPLDYDLETRMIDASYELNQLLLSLTGDEQTIQQQKAIGERNLQEGQTEDYRKSIQNASYRGMAFSSGYQQDRDNISRAYVNQFGDLQGTVANALNQIAAKKLSGTERYNQILEGIKSEAAKRLSDKQMTDPNAAPLKTPMPVGVSGSSRTLEDFMKKFKIIPGSRPVSRTA